MIENVNNKSLVASNSTSANYITIKSLIEVFDTDIEYNDSAFTTDLLVK